MTARITRKSYRAALQEAVDLKGPDFIYEKPTGAILCRYMDGNEPDCIHAHALFSLGHTNLSQYEGLSVSVILSELGVDDEILVQAATRAQFAQDTGSSWGEALEAFDSQLSNPVSRSHW
jgi:hypothetical protein